MDIGTVITNTIAVYGAVLSTLVGIYQYRMTTNRVRVITEVDKFTEPGTIKEDYIVHSINKGHVNVIIIEIGFRVGKSYVELTWGDTDKNDIDRGERFTKYDEIEEINNVLRQKYTGKVKAYPYALDSLGKYHYGKPIQIDLDNK